MENYAVVGAGDNAIFERLMTMSNENNTFQNEIRIASIVVIHQAKKNSEELKAPGETRS